MHAFQGDGKHRGFAADDSRAKISASHSGTPIFLLVKKRRYMLRVFCEGNAFTIEYRLRRKLCMETRSNASYKPLFLFQMFI